MTSARDFAAGDPEPLTPIDAVLRQGAEAARSELWQRAANEPAAMLEMAETVALVEQFRTLRTEPAPTFASKLADVVARAERRLSPRPSRWQGLPWGIAAAAGLFAVLWTWDPLRPCATAVSLAVAPPPQAAAADEAVPDVGAVVVDRREVAWQADVETMRQRLGMESSTHLRQALEAGLEKNPDALGRWLDPRNALVLMRLDHELRASAELRREALRRQGGMPAADVRVQQLAEAIGEQIDAVAAGDAPAGVEGMALAVRALIAAGPGGPSRARALQAGSDWLAGRLPTANALDLVRGLAALVEVTAVTGGHRDLVAQQGERLLSLVLAIDGENWSRRLPELLGPKVPPGVLAEASRVLARLPGLGVDARHCAIVRELLLGPLRDRRTAGEDTPELVAALLYGSADLLGEAERDLLELQLRRWKPIRLAPDFATVQQIAWALEPGRRGFTHHQAELRQLAVCQDPLEMGRRAAFCLCLATNYAAFAGGVLPRLAAGS